MCHLPNTSAENRPDEDLIERFLQGKQSESEEAFRLVVMRHGPMVLGICRRVLERHQDAEDAFQATFLVLARRAATIRNRRVLAGWLCEVAHRIAVKAREETVRRRNLERKVVAMSPRMIVRNETELAASINELRPILHAEVDRLPERYRVPVILSYLEGKTNEEVAELLKWPVGTVKGRLSRARELLRARLVRRGLALSSALLVLILSHETAAAGVVPGELVERTLQLVKMRKPRSYWPDVSSPVARPPTGAGISPKIERLAASECLHRAIVPPAVCIFVFVLVFTAISAAIYGSMLNPVNFSTFRTGLAGFVPFRTSAPSCH